MASAHVVQDLEFEVEFESEEQAFSLQERLSAFAHGPAVRIVAEVFDQACAEPGQLQLERLELDLGTVDPRELEPQWEARLREQLQRVLADLVVAAGTRGVPGAAPAVRRSTEGQAELEALLHYLRQGVLPWQAVAGTDPAELARRVWQNDPTALTARLRGWPEPQAAARRLARQFPAAWCEQLVHALRAGATPEPESIVSGSMSSATAEQHLLQALRATTTVAPQSAAGQATDAPELRAARRRWRALLLDDAPELLEDDLGELMQLWQRLQHEDSDGLLQDLQTLGSRARVRRRMAQMWPETLLRQLPRLWLGEEEGAHALAALQHGQAETDAGGRRRSWEAMLRLLWAGPAGERIDAQALASAMRDHTEPHFVGEPRPGPGRALASLPPPRPNTDLEPRLAASTTASELARGLALWWPAHVAEALAALAFAPLPKAWLREGEPWPRTDRLAPWALQALHPTPDANWTPQGLATRWWRAIAVQLRRSPDELLRVLHEGGADVAEEGPCSAWARWLPPPQPRLANASEAALLEALRRGDRAALRQLGGAQQALASVARQLSGEPWQQLLEVFLAPGQARVVARAQQVLQRAWVELPGADAREAALRECVLAVLLWQPGASAGDVVNHLLEQAARQAGSTADALARSLPQDEQDLFSARVAERAAMDAAARRLTVVADDEAALRQRAEAEAEAVARVIAALRGAGQSLDLAGGERDLLMAWADRGSASARRAIARELESVQAARLLARALSPHELLRLVAWLRPADAAELHQTWPRLLALAEGQGRQAWTPLARTVLRDLFEEDRPLVPLALLKRAEVAVRGAPHAPPKPWELEPPDEPLFVHNAGVVLLAPYLQRLFGLLGLANDKAFVDAESAERAVAVMQYAVTGEATAPETLLPLNKLLCGLALQVPVPRDVALERAEREAVDGMLGAVIGHWKALGQTSVAGLRQTFLQREGRLDHKEEAWHLQVPSRTFDMLIDRLPWGFSTIRYPWMPEVLHVQWR